MPPLELLDLFVLFPSAQVTNMKLINGLDILPVTVKKVALL